MLTGFSNAKLLRVGPDKLYFVSGSGFYVYDLNIQTVPAAPVYTAAFTGFAVMYDRSFAVDPVSGDFAYSTAAGYVAPGLFEIIDGTSFAKIDSGAVTGAAIPNELFLTTSPAGNWDTASLPPLYAECGITLTAPTAIHVNDTITGTTSQMTYNTQGTYTIEWKYVSGADSITQIQLLSIADTTAPVANTAQLPNLTVNCPYTLTPPVATDNCLGIVAGTTDSLTFTVAGTYTLTWTYTDSAGNTATQQQALTVNCDGTAVRDMRSLQASIYPNPADMELVIELPEVDNYHVDIVNTFGQSVLSHSVFNNRCVVVISHLSGGLYLLNIKNSKGLTATKKIIVKH